MMGKKERYFAPLIHVSVEKLVPQDHFYRHLERTLDLSFVREFVQHTYAGGGRPSIDPVVFFKLQLIMFFEEYAPNGNSCGMQQIDSAFLSSLSSICFLHRFLGASSILLPAICTHFSP
jgi:hypothetical protein